MVYHQARVTREVDLLPPLYVIIDIYSRYVAGWLPAKRETVELAERLLAETIREQKPSSRPSSTGQNSVTVTNRSKIAAHFADASSSGTTTNTAAPPPVAPSAGRSNAPGSFRSPTQHTRDAHCDGVGGARRDGKHAEPGQSRPCSPYGCSEQSFCLVHRVSPPLQDCHHRQGGRCLRSSAWLPHLRGLAE